jgi:hypothetical protein
LTILLATSTTYTLDCSKDTSIPDILGWMMLALSIASGFVWLLVAAGRLAGKSLQAAMSGCGVWKVMTETRFGKRLAGAAYLPC